jgi:NTE family protein
MYFVNPLIGYEQRITNVVGGSEVIASIRVKETRAEISAGREFGTWGEARIGIRYADGEAERVIGDPSLTDIPFKRGETFIRLTLDELDDFNIPLGGTFLKAELLQSREGLGADEEFDQLSTQGTVAFTRNRNTLLATGIYNATISGTAPVQNLFTLGGFARLSGFTSRELAGQNVAFGALAYYRRLNDNPRMPFYVGVSIEAGNVWDSRSDISLDDTIKAGSLFMAMKTFLGPVYLAYGRTEGNIDAIHFFLGKPF